MKKPIIFSIIVLGISSVISQLLVIREFTISFYGNEFFIGWILFSWLFWVGMGSLFLNKFFTNNKTFKVLIICQFLVAILLPLEIFLGRLSRTLLSNATGQIPNLIPALLYSFIILAPLCLILGLQFVLVSRFWKISDEKLILSQLLGKSYLLEAIGFIIGGVVFGYFLIFINEFKAVSILAWLNLLSIAFFVLLIKKPTPILKSLLVILIILFMGIFAFSKNINNFANSFLFPNQKLIESKNSIYGNITVTKIKNQYNFYESGLILGPDKEEFFNEQIAHLSLLFHPNPKKILLIGGGFNGVLNEILKHQPDKIFYAEIDPSLIEITRKYIPKEIRQGLEDKKVKIINVDTRYFIKNSSENFDVIIINLPNPSTALINRFYTQEFIKEAKNHLNPEGIITTYLSFSSDYLSKEMENLDVSLFGSLKEIFPYLLVLPGDEHLFICSLDKVDYNPKALIQRLKQRNIKTNFVNEAYIQYRLTNDRVPKIISGLGKNKEAKANQDQRPISYYYNFVYWVSSFYPKLAKILNAFSKIKFVWVVIFLALVLLSLMFVLRKRRDNIKKLLATTMAIAGFSLMATEIIIILGFQIFYGYLYYEIALIITVLMTGITLGSWLGLKKIEQTKIKTIIKIHSLIVVFLLAFLTIFYWLFQVQPKPSIIIEIIFLLMAGLIGLIVGFEFPIVNNLYLKNEERDKKAGTIYGADLLGSCLGALLISILVLPIFGIFQTLILLAILNILIAIYLFSLKSIG